MMIVPEMILPDLGQRQTRGLSQVDGAVPEFAPIFFEAGEGEEDSTGLPVIKMPDDVFEETGGDNPDTVPLNKEGPKKDTDIREAVALPVSPGFESADLVQRVPVAQILAVDSAKSQALVSSEPALTPSERTQVEAPAAGLPIYVAARSLAIDDSGRGNGRSSDAIDFPAKVLALSDAAEFLRAKPVPVAAQPEASLGSVLSEFAKAIPPIGFANPMTPEKTAPMSQPVGPVDVPQAVMPVEAKSGLSTLRYDPTAPTMPSNLPSGREIAAQIAELVKPLKSGGVELQLSPKELGSVSIRFVPNEAGVLVNITAERPETNELLRRHVDVLMQEFRQAGYGAETALSFSQKDDQPSGEHNPQFAQSLNENLGSVDETALPAMTGTSTRLNLLL